MTDLRSGQMMTGPRIPTPVRIRDLIAIQRGTERPERRGYRPGPYRQPGHRRDDARPPMLRARMTMGPERRGSDRGRSSPIEEQVPRDNRLCGTVRRGAGTIRRQGPRRLRQGAGLERRHGPEQRHYRQQLLIRRRLRRSPTCECFPKDLVRRARPTLSARFTVSAERMTYPSRNISRFLDSLADRLKIGLDVPAHRTDRFGRAGITSRSWDLGFPSAARASPSKSTTGNTRT